LSASVSGDHGVRNTEREEGTTKHAKVAKSGKETTDCSDATDINFFAKPGFGALRATSSLIREIGVIRGKNSLFASLACFVVKIIPYP
jgi:hypothetical protein